MKQCIDGFTLVELILVIVLLSIASVGLVALLGQLNNSLVVNNDTQAAAQQAQECAEYLLGVRRRAGYDLGGISDCSALPAFNGFGPPSVTIAAYTSGACSSAACKLVTVKAVRGKGSSTVTLLLTDY
jgi:prepilin-type N-terminal cleavage/methylation domain-containing protein